MSEHTPPDPAGPLTTDADAARRVADALDAAAGARSTWVAPALAALGLSAAVLAAPVAPRLGTLVFLGAVGWMAARLAFQAARAASVLLRLIAAQAEVSARIERHLDDGLRGLHGAVAASRNPAPPEGTAHPVAEARMAIRTARWDDAEALVRGLGESHPDDPDAALVAAELAEARRSAGAEILPRIEAAREANDPERVIELRDEARRLLDAAALLALDRDLARWFLLVIHRRLRTGTVRTDVAVLAGRVAESLNATPEGASLRASLPTLRRAAGLCPRCAQPYKGVADACPACLNGSNGSTAPHAQAEDAPEI